MKAVFNAFADPKNAKYKDYLFAWNDVQLALELSRDFKTNVMAEMSSCWEKNYQVYIVDSKGNEHLIANESNLTPKELRPAHNIYKMWRAGAFDDDQRNTRFREDVIEIQNHGVKISQTFLAYAYATKYNKHMSHYREIDNETIDDEYQSFLYWYNYSLDKDCKDINAVLESMDVYIDSEFI